MEHRSRPSPGLSQALPEICGPIERTGDATRSSPTCGGGQSDAEMDPGIRSQVHIPRWFLPDQCPNSCNHGYVPTLALSPLSILPGPDHGPPGLVPHSGPKTHCSPDLSSDPQPTPTPDPLTPAPGRGPYSVMNSHFSMRSWVLSSLPS